MNCVADGHECQCPAPHPNCEAVLDARRKCMCGYHYGIWMTAAMCPEHGVNAASTTGSPLDEIERLERCNRKLEEQVAALLQENRVATVTLAKIEGLLITYLQRP